MIQEIASTIMKSWSQDFHFTHLVFYVSISILLYLCFLVILYVPFCAMIWYKKVSTDYIILHRFHLSWRRGGNNPTCPKKSGFL